MPRGREPSQSPLALAGAGPQEEAKKELTGTTEFPESPMLGNVGGAPKGLAGLMPGANLPAGLPPVDDRTKKVFEGLPEEKVERNGRCKCRRRGRGRCT
jgi:hypothetical protein